MGWDRKEKKKGKTNKDDKNQTWKLKTKKLGRKKEENGGRALKFFYV